jgi:hypothetical protein
MTREEKLEKLNREFEEMMRRPIGPAKQVDVIRMQFNRDFTQKVRENPEGVMVWLRSADGVSQVQKPIKVWLEEAAPRTIYEKIDAGK